MKVRFVVYDTCHLTSKEDWKKNSCDICSINQCMFCIHVCHSATMGLVVAIRQPTSLFIVQVHTERVYAYFAVICHLHLFCQSDWDLLHAAVLTDTKVRLGLGTDG